MLLIPSYTISNLYNGPVFRRAAERLHANPLRDDMRPDVLAALNLRERLRTPREVASRIGIPVRFIVFK
jgi:hypothetical protein